MYIPAIFTHLLLEPRASDGRRQGTPLILKISAKQGCFRSFEWEKTNFTTFVPPRKILEESIQGPPWKKSFRRPWLELYKTYANGCQHKSV